MGVKHAGGKKFFLYGKLKIENFDAANPSTYQSIWSGLTHKKILVHKSSGTRELSEFADAGIHSAQLVNIVTSINAQVINSTKYS